jgi:hypothetical protein
VWIASPFTDMPSSTWASVIIVLAFVVAYVVMAFAVRRLIPLLVEYALQPAIVVVAHVAAVVLLGVQALLALPFRAVRVRPPGVLYGAGDGIVAGMVGVRASTRELSHLARRLRWVRGRFFVLAILVLAVWWNQNACGLDPRSDRCRHPVAAGAELLRARTADLWHQATSVIVP